MAHHSCPALLAALLPLAVLLTYQPAAASTMHRLYRLHIRRQLDQSFYESFQTLDALQNKWNNLVNDFAPHVRMREIGRSIQQKPIHLLTVGRTNVARPRRLFLNGLQHAREWIAPPVATFIVEQFARHIVRRNSSIAVCWNTLRSWLCLSSM